MNTSNLNMKSYYHLTNIATSEDSHNVQNNDKSNNGNDVTGNGKDARKSDCSAADDNTAEEAGDNPVEVTNLDPKEKKPLHPMLHHVNAQLEMKTLWDEFDSLNTEMIVTKAGR